MKVDLHVHTSKYSPCGVSSPEEMVGAAIASGLDAIVLAEHDYMWDEAELADLQGRFPGIKIFAGIEVSIDAAEHIVVIGVPDRQLFAPFMAPADVLQPCANTGGSCSCHLRWRPEVPGISWRSGWMRWSYTATASETTCNNPSAACCKSCASCNQLWQPPYQAAGALCH